MWCAGIAVGTLPGMSSRSLENAESLRLVGGRIAEARRSAGWSQERLAEALRVDPLTVSRIETGRRQLTITLTLQIADALAVSIGQLVGRVDPSADLVAEVAALLAPMPPGRKETALRVLRELAREERPADA